MKAFGLFKEDDNYRDYAKAEFFAHYQSIKNRLPKSVILSYLQSLPYWAVAPGIATDFMTGETLPVMGIYQDGEFRFPVEFLHYYEKYDIGIPLDYEEYLIKEKGLSG